MNEPWITRVTGQLLAAYDGLEEEITRHSLAVSSANITQVGVTTAVAWHFSQQVIPQIVPATSYPLLAAYSARAEALPEFRAAPYGDGTCRQES